MVWDTKIEVLFSYCDVRGGHEACVQSLAMRLMGVGNRNFFESQCEKFRKQGSDVLKLVESGLLSMRQTCFEPPESFTDRLRGFSTH